MTVHKLVFVLDCGDPVSLARFWTEALGYRQTYAGGDPYVLLEPAGEQEGRGWPEIFLQRVEEPKTAKNRMHLDFRVDDLDTEVNRLVDLGARRLTHQPLEEAPFRWHILADPQDNEFCVVAELPVVRA